MPFASRPNEGSYLIFGASFLHCFTYLHILEIALFADLSNLPEALSKSAQTQILLIQKHLAFWEYL